MGDNDIIIQQLPEESQTPTPTPSPTITPTLTKTPTPTPTKTPTPTPTKKPPRKLECGEEGVNECNVLTIFTMGATCEVIEPSTLTSSDGTITLIVTGGTSPYTINWDNGNFGNTITNLSVGTYTAVVVDYYGDFTAYTSCKLVGTMPTPTPTPTPTQTPASIGYSLCVNITYQDEVNSETYIPSGTFNGKQSWSASTSQILWSASTNQWFIYPSPIGGYIINNNTSSPPNTGWIVLGVPSPQPVTVQVYTGNCESEIIIT